LIAGNSLLPCGIERVEGKFKKGEVVRINGFAKGVVNHSSSEIAAMVAACQKERAEGRRNGNGRAVVNSEDIVLHD